MQPTTVLFLFIFLFTASAAEAQSRFDGSGKLTRVNEVTNSSDASNTLKPLTKAEINTDSLLHAESNKTKAAARKVLANKVSQTLELLKLPKMDSALKEFYKICWSEDDCRKVLDYLVQLERHCQIQVWFSLKMHSPPSSICLIRST